MKKRSFLRLIRAFDTVVILALVFQPVSAPVFFAPHMAIADDAVVADGASDTEVAEEDPAPVTQEEELPADQNQEEAETAPETEPASVPVEDEAEEGTVEAEGDAFTETPAEEGIVEAEGESFIEAPAEKAVAKTVFEPEKTKHDGDCDGDSKCARPVCSADSVINGGFESPHVTDAHKWDYFDGYQVPGWMVEWYGGSSSFGGHSRPAPKIEIQAGVSGWGSASDQYVELDSDWDGPSGAMTGEPASVSIRQTIPTVPGYKYTLSWDYAARPNHSDNKLKVEVNGDEVFESGKIAGGGSVRWITKSHAFTASGNNVTIRFTETGKADSFGMFLDGVSLKCIGREDPAKGKIIVKKETNPDRDRTAFDFVLKKISDGEFRNDEDAEDFSLSDGQSHESVLLPGKYSVSETVPEGWNLTSAVCTDGINTYEPSDIGLNAGRTVTCDFTNTLRQGTITLRKIVINDDGGTATKHDFQPEIDGNPVSWGVPVALVPGVHNVNETGLTGYAASSWGGDCLGSRNIVLSYGENKTCTITNDDIAPKLTVIKKVINDDGGTKVAGDFIIKVNAGHASPASFQGDAAGTIVTVNAGGYGVTEQPTPGYVTTYSDDCSGSIAIGQEKTCIVINNDRGGTLIVTKIVQNDGFGTKTVGDFPLYVGSTPVISGVSNSFSAGTYTVFEAGHPGYSATFSGDCDADGTVTLLPGDVKSCRIVNDDRFGKIIVKKETVPDQDETVFDFVLNEVSDEESRNDESAEDFSLSDGQSHEAVLLPGTYSVSESVPEGWDLTSAVCTGEESVSDIDLSDGETVTCTFTNTKDEPVVVPETGKITVEKRTKNAGSDQLFSFIPSYSGNFLLSNGGFQVSDSLAPGFYSVREAELYGWDLSALACIDRAGVSTVSIDKNGMTAGIQLAAGGDVLCTFTNKDTKRSDDPWDGNGGNHGVDGTTGGGSATTALAAGPVVISGTVAAGAAETAPEDGSVEGTESGIVEGASDCVGGWPLWAWILLVIVHTAVSTLKRVIRKPVVQKWGIPAQLISAIAALVIWYLFDICREYWPYVPIAIVFVTIASLFLFRHWKK